MGRLLCIAANHLENDTDFFRYEMVNVLLTSVGIDQGFAFDRQIEEYYYEPWQMGDPAAMVYGSVDVSWPRCDTFESLGQI